MVGARSLSADVPLLKRRRTKIIATLGPASSEAGAIRELIRAGVNVFRLNMSHGSHESHASACERVRHAAEEVGEPVGVLVDLSGPKIRVGAFQGGAIPLEEGASVTVTTRDVVGEPGLVPSQYEGLARDVRLGARILLDDGLLELRVDAIQGDEVRCTVIHGGVLKDRKGMNLPDTELSADSLTEKDREDARFALQLEADFLALSFVRSAADVRELRRMMPDDGPVMIAKVERPEALQAIGEILEASDGVMVARGDLGVELPPEAVPIVQRELVSEARARNRITIVATQMLESMVHSPQATRAEASDVANAVFSGADAIMLSAETASGKHPVRTVEMMDRIVRRAEGYMWREGAFGSIAGATETAEPVPVHLAVARSTGQLSRDLRVRSIVVLSRSGVTAAVVSGARPAAPVIAATTDRAACRRMSLLWGVAPVQVAPADFRHPEGLARRLVRDLGLAEPGQYILTVTGFKPDPAQHAPSITVLRV